MSACSRSSMEHQEQAPHCIANPAFLKDDTPRIKNKALLVSNTYADMIATASATSPATTAATSLNSNSIVSFCGGNPQEQPSSSIAAAAGGRIVVPGTRTTTTEDGILRMDTNPLVILRNEKKKKKKEHKHHKEHKKKEHKKKKDKKKKRSRSKATALRDSSLMGDSTSIMGDSASRRGFDADSVWGDENQWKEDDWNVAPVILAASRPPSFQAIHPSPFQAASSQLPDPSFGSRSSSLETHYYDAAKTGEWSGVGNGPTNAASQPGTSSHVLNDISRRSTMAAGNINTHRNDNNSNNNTRSSLEASGDDTVSYGIMSDLQSYMDENVSVLTGDENLSFVQSNHTKQGNAAPRYHHHRPSRTNSGASSGGDTSKYVPHELLVDYMLAMGANREAAEELAFGFTSEQHQKQRQQEQQYRAQHSSVGRHGQPAALALSIKLKEAEQGNGDYYNNRHPYEQQQRRYQQQQQQQSAASYSVHRSSIDDGSSYLTTTTAEVAAVAFATSTGHEIVEAMPVKDNYLSELPIVYADPTPISFKDLVLNERPVRRVFCLSTLLLIIGSAIGSVVYFVVLKEQAVSDGSSMQTTFPTASPSQSPTFVADDILEAAIKLSGWDILSDRTSPQFRAVGWMSAIDEVETGGYGGQVFAQRYALTVIYYSFQGEDWINPERWLTPSLHECEWSSGIFCRYDETQTLTVTGFDATRNNLQGSVPFEIGILSKSETFRIPKNNVGGSIPDSIGKLTSLSAVDMSDNAITGSIPASFEGARDLILVDLSKNQLSSSIPDQLYNLEFLRTLVLKSNQLSGTLSPSLNNYTSLVSLDLRDNKISGTLPVTLDSIQTLDTLLLDYNQFTGSLPPITISLTLKQTLGLSHNQFSGNLALHPSYEYSNDPADLRLKYVDLSYNLLSGPISPLFGFLPTFRYFDLSGNNFMGTFPSSVGWDSIEFLAAANNALTGTIPSGYPTLTHLDFSNNLFSQDIPEGICEYPDLEFLLLSGNPLQSTIPTCLASMPRLRDLELIGCGLQGPIPSALGQIPDLAIFDVSGNSLASTIPTELGDLTTMKHLRLQDNLLTGSIPSELADMTDLRTLNLKGNAITGTFPPELEVLVELESLLLVQSNNTKAVVRGDIPAGLCELSSLEVLSQEVGCGIICDCCNDFETVCG